MLFLCDLCAAYASLAEAWIAHHRKDCDGKPDALVIHIPKKGENDGGDRSESEVLREMV